MLDINLPPKPDTHQTSRVLQRVLHERILRPQWHRKLYPNLATFETARLLGWIQDKYWIHTHDIDIDIYLYVFYIFFFENKKSRFHFMQKRVHNFWGQNIQTSDLRAISLDSFKDTKHPALHSFLCGK